MQKMGKNRLLTRAAPYRLLTRAAQYRAAAVRESVRCSA